MASVAELKKSLFAEIDKVLESATFVIGRQIARRTLLPAFMRDRGGAALLQKLRYCGLRTLASLCARTIFKIWRRPGSDSRF